MRLLASKRVQTTLGRYFSKVFESIRKTETDGWEPVIGLEIHAQISANSKLFSGSATNFGAPINNSVSFFDASLPGTLPVLNKACVTAALKTAVSLNCIINRVSYFDRKHYFYADLPAGYQITQKRLPLASKGHLIYPIYEGKNFIEKMAHLTQIQLEQDSGKSLHDIMDKMSLIDLNRAGIGLMEIITEPDFKSAKEVVAFVKELQLVLQTIGSCNAKMEEGSLRVDASISVRKPNDPLGVRTEVKNLNSIRSLGRAVEFEIERQIKSLENGIPVENQTMFYDSEADCTIVLRDKEKVHDYRFLPEPNLVPLHIKEDLQAMRKELPMLPRMKRDWLVKENKLTLEQSVILVSIPELLYLYNKCSSHINDQKLNFSIANFCINEILALINKRNTSLNESKLDTMEVLEIMLMLLVEKTINLTIARKVLDMLMDPTQCVKSARLIVEKENMKQLSDISSLMEICQELVEEHQEAVKDFKAGNKKVMNFFIGQVQKKTGGRANGQSVTRIFQDLLTK